MGEQMMQLHCTLEKKLIREPCFIFSIALAKACPQDLFIDDFDTRNAKRTWKAPRFQSGKIVFGNSEQVNASYHTPGECIWSPSGKMSISHVVCVAICPYYKTKQCWQFVLRHNLGMQQQGWQLRSNCLGRAVAWSWHSSCPVFLAGDTAADHYPSFTNSQPHEGFRKMVYIDFNMTC